MIEDRDNEGTDRVERQLEAERPVPSPAFRGKLRRHLLAASASGGGRARALVAGYAGSGLTLLAVAALGVAGGGPFAP